MKIVMPEANTLTRGDVDLSPITSLEDTEVVTLENPTKEQLIAELSNADAILINKTVLDEDTLKNAKNLKYIGECATGYNNIDIDYCNAHGIMVTNVPDYSTNAVAQQVFAYILDHYSKVRDYNDFVDDDGWVNSKTFSPFVFDTDELFGKTIGLVGYGKIGKAVAKIANAFGMNVLVFTRSYAKAVEASRNSWGDVDRTVLDGFINNTESFVTYVTLDNLLKHSDIVSVHCPLNAESEKMFCAETFKKMRKGAFFINTARGGILDETALAEALQNGKLSGAALDVLTCEPEDSNCPLRGIKNCTITPHVAWAPYATRKRLVTVVYNNIQGYIKNRPQNVVTN